MLLVVWADGATCGVDVGYGVDVAGCGVDGFSCGVAH